MKHKLLTGLVLALTAGVQAETIPVKLEQYTFSPLIVSMPGGDVHAGQYQGLIDGKTGTAWCVELGGFLQFGTGVGYEVLDADEVFGQTAAQVLDRRPGKRSSFTTTTGKTCWSAVPGLRSMSQPQDYC